jgi:hypothetical protein
MAKVFDLYGLRQVGMEQAKNLLLAALGMPFVLHDSEWWGEYYLARRETPEWEKIRLYLNENQDPHRWGNEPYDLWNEPEHSDCPLLIEASLSSRERASDIEACLREAFTSEQMILIKHSEYPD